MRDPDSAVVASQDGAVHAPDGAPAPRTHGYLEMLDLFRVIACGAVLAQHSFIWTNMSGNFIGTGFIAILHLSRNSFFFLTALVVTYSQINHPRTRREFWKHRYWEVGVPYLAWTGIYLLFTLITVNASWDQVGVFLRHNLLLGYSQMYFVFVIFQFYLVFPWALKFLRSSAHQSRILFLSLGFAVLIDLFLHDPSWFAPLSDFSQSINHVWPWGRDILVYQEFLIAGMLVALHLDRVLAFVAGRYRQIMVGTAAMGAVTVLWYVLSVWSGDSVERASDIYEPIASLWSLAAIAGIFSLSWWRFQRAKPTSHGTSPLPRWSVTSLAGMTGGIFFAHTLFINMIRSALSVTGLRATMPWAVTVAILFVGTVTLTGLFVSLVLKTPLRWVLGGPVRAEQRATFGGVLETSTGPAGPAV
jgi:membrane-bound acyltransferase YfiQ involved in biofilm formation